jgi:hypothetical protein
MRFPDKMDHVFFREDLVDLKKEHMMAIAMNDFCIDKIMNLQYNNPFVSEKARKHRKCRSQEVF